MTNSPIQKISTKSGMTLIEILVVAVLTSILFFAGYTAYKNILEQRTLQAETSQIANTLRLAQNLSVTAQESLAHGVRFETSYYQLITQDDSLNIEGQRQYQLSSGITISSDQNPIIFQKRTGSLENEVNIIINSREYSSEIKISKSGNVTSNIAKRL